MLEDPRLDVLLSRYSEHHWTALSADVIIQQDVLEAVCRGMHPGTRSHQPWRLVYRTTTRVVSDKGKRRLFACRAGT